MMFQVTAYTLNVKPFVFVSKMISTLPWEVACHQKEK